ncbi:membrane integrity-associated transporter subunit PqiC [Sphingomonas sp. CGMCC 1.13654]|uniref:Membrane integrity-associated transporter subunit PqiC n=1 Tax=Sphingomonas chungangi TaxID=2683589 RepID=A0A838L6B5_9SPHN|nr:ABC-type transport auxiliary lipoprotein family protein [Sphingomonas chungangi]MBA2934881.1 membrane integrity-associated transporter subunit PqiC [Sphingomonas chungangi]MVW58192.1 ABC transporter [Sphingomonas chungangi]
MTKRVLPLIALPLVLAGCVSFGAKVPPQLLRLTPVTEAPANSGVVLAKGMAVSVSFPSAPVELSNNRVPVRVGATEVAYVKDAQWIDAPSHIFRDLLAETITARTGRPTLTPRDAALTSGPRLGGRISEFGIDASGNQASVVYDATLVRSGDQVETRRFEAKAPVNGKIDESSAGAAINAAANDVAAQVADWVGR